MISKELCWWIKELFFLLYCWLYQQPADKLLERLAHACEFVSWWLCHNIKPFTVITVFSSFSQVHNRQNSEKFPGYKSRKCHSSEYSFWGKFSDWNPSFFFYHVYETLGKSFHLPVLCMLSAWGKQEKRIQLSLLTFMVYEIYSHSVTPANKVLGMLSINHLRVITIWNWSPAPSESLRG